MTRKPLWAVVGILVVSLSASVEAQIHYWTGWEDDDWTNSNNWALNNDGPVPADSTPGASDEANLWQISHPDTLALFNGFSRIPSGVAIDILRLEWRCCQFVGPNRVGITVEGTLNTPDAAFGNWSIAATLTVPAGGTVNVTNTFWLAQNYDDARSAAAATNGGANLNVDGGIFIADTLEVGWTTSYFDPNPEIPYVNVRVTNGGLIELGGEASFGLNINGGALDPGQAVTIDRLEWRAGKSVGPDPVGLTVEGTLNMPSAAFGNNSIASTLTIPRGGAVNVVTEFFLGQNWPDGDPQSSVAADNGGANLNVNGGTFTANTLQVAWGDNHFEQSPLAPYVKVRGPMAA